MQRQSILNKTDLKGQTQLVSFLKFLILVVICRLLMDGVYSLSISPFFDYAGMKNAATRDSILLSWRLLLLFYLFIFPFFSATKDSFISSLILVLFAIRVISFTSFIKFVPQPSEFIFYNTIYWCWFLFLLNCISSIRISLPSYKSDRIVGFFTIISILTVIIVSGVYTGFRLQFSFEDIYDLREEARGYSMPTLLAYLLSATGNLIPILVVYYILKGRKFFVVLLFLAGILNFGIAGQKATIFKILACVAMIYLVNIDLKKYIIPFIVLLLALALLLYVAFDNVSIPWIVVRRMFYTTNVIDTMYYDYISIHGPLFFDSEATGQLAFSISELYGTVRGGRANNGMFSDAFVNLGTFGLFIMPILLTLVLKLFSIVLRGQNKSIVFFTAVVLGTTLTGAFLTRCLLTHGFLLILLVLYFMPLQNKEDRSRISISS